MLTALGRLRERRILSSGPARTHQDPISESKIILHSKTQFCRGAEQGEGKVNVLLLSRVTSFVYFICSEQLKKGSPLMIESLESIEIRKERLLADG